MRVLCAHLCSCPSSSSKVWFARLKPRSANTEKKGTMTLEEILRSALQKGATDVHLKAGVMPVIRRHGSLRALDTQIPPLTGEQIDFMARSIMDEKQRASFQENHEIDLSYGISGLGRFRVSVF